MTVFNFLIISTPIRIGEHNLFTTKQLCDNSIFPIFIEIKALPNNFKNELSAVSSVEFEVIGVTSPDTTVFLSTTVTLAPVSIIKGVLTSFTSPIISNFPPNIR